MDLEGVLLYGPRMKWLYEKMKTNGPIIKLIWSEDDHNPIIDVLRQSTDKDSIVLLKGSRGMALEKILESFLMSESD